MEFIFIDGNKSHVNYFFQSVKHLTTVRLVVVPCPPVVEVLIRRPDTKYQVKILNNHYPLSRIKIFRLFQLGFSVQNGIVSDYEFVFHITEPFSFLQICSLLRGGIAERGGVRVGHRIIEINGQSVVATQHERIVSMLSNSIGEVSPSFFISNHFVKLIDYLATDENNANTDVSSINWTRKSHVYIKSLSCCLFVFFCMENNLNIIFSIRSQKYFIIVL